MTSIERIKQYGRLEQEAAAEHTEHSTPDKWPNEGAILFNHVTLSYTDGRSVALKDISFFIKPCEKVVILNVHLT